MASLGFISQPPARGNTQINLLFLYGYRAQQVGAHEVLMRDPQGRCFRINTHFRTCSCRDTKEAAGQSPCVHLEGYAGLLTEQEAFEEAQVETLEAFYDPWGLTLESDQIERGLREIGVCEF